MNMIYDYQLSNDRKLLHYLLAKFDRLLADIIHEVRNKRTVLKEEPIQEMYHVAVIGFEKSLFRISKDFDPNLLPAKIRSYVLASIKSFYYHKVKEFPTDDAHAHDKLGDRAENPHKRNQAKLDIEALFEATNLPQDWLTVIFLKYLEDNTLQDIQDKTGLTEDAVRWRLSQGMLKLQEEAAKESNPQ